MLGFRSHIYDRKNHSAKLSKKPIKPVRYKCICGTERIFRGFSKVPTEVYCPNALCGCRMRIVKEDSDD